MTAKQFLYPVSSNCETSILFFAKVVGIKVFLLLLLQDVRQI